jgi:hypothetical protein
VPWDLGLRVTALVRHSINCIDALQTTLLVREGAPQEETRNYWCLNVVYNNFSKIAFYSLLRLL